MAPTTHPSSDLVMAFADHDADAMTDEGLRAHMASCRTGRDLANDFTELGVLVKTWVVEAVPGSLTLPSGRVRRRLPSWQHVVLAVSALAAVLVVILTAYQFTRCGELGCGPSS